jgi:hypothetical protein
VLASKDGEFSGHEQCDAHNCLIAIIGSSQDELKEKVNEGSDEEGSKKEEHPGPANCHVTSSQGFVCSEDWCVQRKCRFPLLGTAWSISCTNLVLIVPAGHMEQHLSLPVLISQSNNECSMATCVGGLFESKTSPKKQCDMR